MKETEPCKSLKFQTVFLVTDNINHDLDLLGFENCYS